MGGQNLIFEVYDDWWAPACRWLTKFLVFTLWNTSCIIFSHLKLIKVHFLTLFWLFGHWIPQNGLKWPPGQIHQFWVNGSEFSNSLKSGWKYNKFSTKITSSQIWAAGLPCRLKLCRKIYPILVICHSIPKKLWLDNLFLSDS